MLDDNLTPLMRNVLRVFGLLLGFFFIIYGFEWAIPKQGVFGILWTLLAIGITATNLYTFFFKKTNQKTR